MKLIEILKPDFFFEDERGSLCQITHEKFTQTNAVFSKKNSVRGNFHYHKTAEEIFYIISGEVTVDLFLDGESQQYNFASGDMFRINKNVRHRFSYSEDTYLVVFYSSEIELDDGTKDIISDESCPFKAAD